jgi:hypothetical protein
MPRTRPYDPEQPLTPTTWLGRTAFAEALRLELGVRISPATLASKASRRAGPPYRLNLDRTAEYQWGPGSSWAQAELVYRLSGGLEPEAALLRVDHPDPTDCTITKIAIAKNPGRQ